MAVDVGSRRRAMPEYMVREQAATMFNVSPKTFAGWVGMGAMPEPRRVVGRSQLWDLADLERCLQTLNPLLVGIVSVKNPGLQELGEGVYACPARDPMHIG